ncbi:MAG: type I-C CRISPR-associated protein Cas8c/Csd1 [Anaerolineae bacterium UTCFX1]|jgi:CRISPR-associated protein Csd1|nr:MAG: type I-C CRISPR-associated protein Cas8c/Csd1 [Anaerolineae bacterium UTCFX1]
MSWIQKLYETYNNSQSMIGAGTDDNEVPLLPICHTTQKAQIEITLDGNGLIRRARVLSKEEARTIIPCTESSGGRTSGEAAHPLCDKLQYIAKDYKHYGGDKDSYYESYFMQLSNWAESEKNKKIQIICKYIERGDVISDLVEKGILVVDKSKKLLKQRSNEKDKKAGLDIFDLLPGKIDPKTKKVTNWQADAFVRWKVEIPNDPQSAVWSDQEILESWVKYYSSTKESKAFCYATGEDVFSADQHPAKLRNDGDKAKLISSNDMSGFTFRGRFTASEQVVSVGFETTQKAHFALRWLIARQGYRNGDLAIVAWATSGASIPSPMDDTFSILGADDLVSDQMPRAFTAQDVAIRFKKKIAGYGREIGNTTDIVVMGLDSASKGRLSITYYRELTGSDFLQRIDDWHTSCAWLHGYGRIEYQDDSGKTRKKYIPFEGAPAPNDIAEVAYGHRLDDKLRKATISRILPCIVDGQPIPRDFVESVVRRASNRIGIKNLDDKKYHNDEEFTWKKTLSVACALFRKFKQGKEKYEMSLDETRTTRDYLYGRLLAIADVLEEKALYKGEKKRATNAARYMQQFSQRPFQTWKQIHDSLTPSFTRLGGGYYFKNLIAEVTSLNPEALIGNTPLTGEYLLGYYCQRQKLLEKNEKPSSNEVEDGDEDTQE